MTPPPWTLRGHGLVALYAPAPRSPLGALMLVRYASSPVGPYDELLWVEAPVASPAGPRPRVRATLVSTPESVEWGRRNWGIPKHLAAFGWEGEPGRGQVRVTGEEGQAVAHLAYQGGGPRLPVTTALVPAPLRTLAQPALDGAEGWLLTTPGAQGHVTPARLVFPVPATA
jgi:hypothetical protein